MLRKPDSLSPEDVVIKDPMMEPFFIVKSTSGGYVVYERVTKANNSEYLKTINYPSTFNYALKSVAKQKLGNLPQKEYNTVKEFVTKWEEISEQLNNLTSINV